MKPSLLLFLLLAGCTSVSGPARPPVAAATATAPMPPPTLARDERGFDVAVYALGLIDTGYRYGGKNPSAGLDCSGMVSHVFAAATGIRLAGSAADIAAKGRAIEASQLRPGDLVFFNTGKKPYSHVGIYIGEDRFVHAPKANGFVRTESLKQSYFASRFEEARRYFD